MPERSRLSVIVPVYNVERYLSECLDSLLAQTRPVDEILVVDDSTDRSTAIAEDYARRFPAVRVVRGPGRDVASARNRGLDLARGDWIGFVDADDRVEPTTYERLLSHAGEHELDMVLCNARYRYGGGKADEPVYKDHPPCGPMPGGEWLAAKLEKRSFLHAIWMHVYRRAFIEANRLRMPEGVQHEDVVWTTRALVAAKQVYYDDEPLYIYRAAQAEDPAQGAEEKPDAGSVATRTMAYISRNPQRFGREALDERLVSVIRGAKYNARALAEIADGADARLARALRWQLVDGGLSVFHKIRQLSSKALRRAEWRKALDDGFLALLWRCSVDARQKRKVASRFLRALATRGFR